MVWTFLGWQGGPFMRYAMGDVARVMVSPCASGTPGLRFSIVGRADDMMIVKGVNIYPVAIQNELIKFRPHVTGIFRIVLPAPGPSVASPVQITIEHSENGDPSDLENLAARIIDHIHETLRIATIIKWVPANHFPRESHKTKLVEIGPINAKATC